MLDENCNRFKRPFNIHAQRFFLYRPFILKMVAFKVAVMTVLTELVDSHDEKPRQMKTREWIKRTRESDYFQNIFQELKVEDQMGFKDKFRMSVTDYEFLLSQISDLISSNERISGNRPILADEKLALISRYLVTGESF